MRKPWIAIAMIALLVGVTAGYRMGRVANPERVSARADRGAETPHEEPGAREDATASREPPRSSPESPAAPIAASPRSRDDDTPGPRSSERTIAGASQEAAASRSVPARPESEQTAQAPPRSVDVSSPPGLPIGQPVPIPDSPPATTGLPANELAKGDGAAVPAEDPESDRHPPVLLYLRFDPPEIKDGGVATLSVGASDDLSGVKLVFGTVRSPSEAAIMPFAAQDATGSGVFTTRITIPHQAETGDWFVASVQIVDKADNPLNLAFPKATVPQGGALRVSSDESDSTAPDVHRVSIDKASVGAGERNEIVVEVDDDRSGVGSVTGTFQSPSKSAFVPFACRAQGESTWVGAVPVPADADCGEWTLKQLRVADKANNTAYLTVESPQVGPVAFVVSGGGACDSDPPVIDALYVSPAIVSNASASQVSLTFTIHDDRSGVGSLSGWVEGPVSASGQVPKIFFAREADSKDPGAPMTARISVPQYAAKGIWRVSLVLVMDKARNTRTYNIGDPALVNASFMVE
jgi:hypothetical protein